jgi:hypothetical protein
MALLSKPTALFETTITETIDEADTTIPLQSLSNGQGSTLVNGTTVGLILDEGEDSGNADYGQEFIIGTVDTGNTRLTSCLRGVSLVDGVTEVTANKKKHRRGASVKMTAHPYLVRVIRLLNGEDTIDPTALIAYTSGPTFSSDHQLITKKYADDLAIAGAPDGAEAVKGIYEAATSAEVAAGDDSGTTTAPTVVRPSKLAEVIQAGSYIYAVEDGSGSDDTYAWTTTPVTSAYTTGSVRLVKFTVANTGACTGNENSIGAKTIKKYAAGALADLETGDIVANQACLLYYDGTYLVLLNPSATMPTTALLSEMVAFFGATDATGAEVEALTAFYSNPGLTTDGSTTTTTSVKTITVSCGFVPVNFEAVVVLGIAASAIWSSGSNTALGQQTILIKGEIGGNVTWRLVAATSGAAAPSGTAVLDAWTGTSPSFGSGTAAAPGTGTTNSGSSDTFGLTSIAVSGNDLQFNFTFTKTTNNCGLRYGVNFLSVSNS